MRVEECSNDSCSIALSSFPHWSLLDIAGQPNMIRRKRLLRFISASAAATTISDGSSGACSAAAFVPLPILGPVPTRIVRPQSHSMGGLWQLDQKLLLLRGDIFASRSVDADDSRSSASPPASSLLQSILLDQSIEDISDRISSRIVLPFYVPQPIISAATTLAVQQLTTDVLSSDLLERIGEVAVASASTKTSAAELMDGDDNDDGVPDNEEIDGMSEQIAVELNAQIDLPVLDEEQELVIFQAIGRALMAVLTTPDEIEVDPKQVVDLAVETAQELLGGKEGRCKLAQVLNAKLDFPILNEEAEQDLLERALDACADRLLEVLPREMVDALRGVSSYDGLEKTKGFIVASINRKVDIIGLTEEQEAQCIAMLVDVVFDLIIGDTEFELLLMNPEERMSALQEKKVALGRQLEIAKKRHEAELTNLEAHIRRIEERMAKDVDSKTH